MSKLVNELTLRCNSRFTAKVIEKIEDLSYDITSFAICNANVRFSVIVIEDCQLDRHAQSVGVVFVHLLES